MWPHWRTVLVFGVWLCLILVLWAYGMELGLAVVVGALPAFALECVLILVGGGSQLSKGIGTLSGWIARQWRRLF